MTTTGSLNPNLMRETDSLAEDSIQQYYQEAVDNLTQGNNGYDFLIDEEYQQVKQLQQELGFAKWRIMGEKVSLVQILREVYFEVRDQNQQLLIQKAPQKSLIGSFSNANSLNQLYPYLKQTLQDNNQLINQLLDKYQQLKFIAHQEQEKSQYLESQLNLTKQKSTFAQFSADSLDNRERYIEELEQQLQETRKVLLEKKLSLSDKDEEILNLKRQLQNTDANFQKLEEQKREIDQLVIKVSQELRNKEFDLSYQQYNDNSKPDNNLAKQVEMLKKELQEERNRKGTLEQIEGDLLFKYQQREEELHQIQTYNIELEEKVRVNSEAIEKAQKVIERLNDEMDRQVSIMQQLEQERDAYKNEAKEQSKRIVELNKQVQVTQVQLQMNQQQVSIQLKQEVDELKEALQQYQQQFDEERRQLNLNLREANEDKFNLHNEIEKLDASYKKQLHTLQQQLDDIMKQNQLKIKQIELEFQEQKDILNQQRRETEEQAQGQIKYLQKRMREQQSEFQNSKPLNKNPLTQSTGKASYLNVIRQEFEKVSNELMDCRQIVKQYSTDLNVIGIPAKLKQFEDFRDKVMQQLSDWEVKSEGLTQLSQKYQREIEEYRRLFLQMKTMLKEKDKLIQQIQRSVRYKDSYRDSYANTIKKELDRQTYLIKADLLDQFRMTQVTAQNVSQEQIDQERRMQAFKHEYLVMLEDRENLSNNNLRLIGQVEVLTRDLDKISQQYYDFSQRIRVIMGYHSNTKSEQQIYSDIETIIDELKIRNEEVISYKSQLESLQIQQSQDKLFMQQKVQSVEEQLNNIQRSNIAKEEELQLLYMQKEAKLHTEIQKQVEECQKLQQHLQSRERQVKKLQEQKDKNQEEITKLQQQVEQMAKEKDEMETECKQTVEVINQVQQSLENTQSELEKKQTIMQDQEAQIQKIEERNKQFKDQLITLEIELQRERDLNLQLQDEKYQAVLQRDSAIEKQKILERENQNIYKDLVIQKENVKEISKAYDDCEHEKYELQNNCQQMNDVVSQVQDEVIQSQKAIESLNHALDRTRRKYNKAKELKHQIKVMKQHENQLNEVIDSLRRQLHPVRQSQEIQTNESGMQELIYHHEENNRLQKQIMMYQMDIQTLQDSLQRQTIDINRLIDEKRDLEDLVDQQNQSIKQIRLNNQTINNLNIAVKENQNNLNQLISKGDNDLYTKILQEKENYIMRLEHEISDMRKEMDQLKEKLISYEIGSLSLDRSLGGHARSIQMNKQQSNMIPQGHHQNSQVQALKHQSQGFRLNNTYNSLHFSNMHNATNATNYQTIQQQTEDYNRGMLNRSMHN